MTQLNNCDSNYDDVDMDMDMCRPYPQTLFIVWNQSNDGGNCTLQPAMTFWSLLLNSYKYSLGS